MVIAIIAILAAMLLPALSKARAKARDISCKNNFKTLAMGLLMYVGDNDDLLPGPDYRFPFFDPVSPFVLGVGEYVSATDTTKGPKEATVWFCPAAGGSLYQAELTRANGKRIGIINNSGYGASDVRQPWNYMFGYPGKEQPKKILQWSTPLQNGRAISMTEIPVYVELNKITADNTDGTIPYEPAHGDSFNLFWADGHVTGYKIAQYSTLFWCPYN